MDNVTIIERLTKMETTLEDIKRAVSGHDQEPGLTGRVRQLETDVAILKNNFRWMAWLAGLAGGLVGNVGPSVVKWIFNAI